MMPVLPEELAESCAKEAQAFSVAAEIHPQDFIFWNMHDALPAEQRIDAVRNYFQSGATTAQWIKSVVEQLAGIPASYSFLDFASGYGRVARHLGTALPRATVVTSDIHPEAVSFNKSIGLGSVLSSTVPEEFDPKQTFDVICAISFFTHMPARTWGRWLRAIAKYLEPNGKFMFTTHGRPSTIPMGVNNVSPAGYAFHPHSEQKDLDIVEYGSTTTFFEFVHREVLNADLRVVWFKEAGAGYQDLVVVTPVS